jgi:predicted TIM-barrel fold metal-dependent hydrolase
MQYQVISTDNHINEPPGTYVDRVHDPVLASATMFSSDDPHSTTLWPRSKEYIARMTEGMSAETRQAILSGNAVRAYSLN